MVSAQLPPDAFSRASWAAIFGSTLVMWNLGCNRASEMLFFIVLAPFAEVA